MFDKQIQQIKIRKAVSNAMRQLSSLGSIFVGNSAISKTSISLIITKDAISLKILFLQIFQKRNRISFILNLQHPIPKSQLYHISFHITIFQLQLQYNFWGS